jgi:REP element-mobilizing transposase RayT
MRPHFRPFADLGRIQMRRRNLPHWEYPGATYFLTFRLSDSLPAGLQRGLQIQRAAWLRANNLQDQRGMDDLTPKLRKEYHCRFTSKEHQWLDEGHGRCLLRQPTPRKIVEGALFHFDHERYVLDAFVIMPNHVHVLVLPLAGHFLSDITASWKKFAARQINAALATGNVRPHCTRHRTTRRLPQVHRKQSGESAASSGRIHARQWERDRDGTVTKP